MIFEIDVSGQDLLTPNYTVCIANKDLIKGFKFSAEYVQIINSRFGSNFYRYKKSRKGKASLKVRIYCIIIYFLLKSIKCKEIISLDLCRDFDGRESDIKENLLFLIENKLNIKLERISFVKLSNNSNAHIYSYLMRKDNNNKLQTYVSINLSEIEEFLIKK